MLWDMLLKDPLGGPWIIGNFGLNSVSHDMDRKSRASYNLLQVKLQQRLRRMSRMDWGPGALGSLLMFLGQEKLNSLKYR